MNMIRPAFSVLLVAFCLGMGCTTPKPIPNPLIDWRFSNIDNFHSNKIIREDCQDYIQTLSLEERKYLGPSPFEYFEDGAGQHAVQITIGLNNKVWRHVLMYDKDNKRIKTIKYISGDYRS